MSNSTMTIQSEHMIAEVKPGVASIRFKGSALDDLHAVINWLLKCRIRDLETDDEDADVHSMIEENKFMMQLKNHLRRAPGFTSYSMDEENLGDLCMTMNYAFEELHNCLCEMKRSGRSTWDWLPSETFINSISSTASEMFSILKS